MTAAQFVVPDFDSLSLEELEEKYENGPEHFRRQIRVAEHKKLAEQDRQSKPAAAQAKPAVAGKQFLEAFGEKGGVWFAEGKTFEQASKLYVESLKADNKARAAEIANLKMQLVAFSGKGCRAEFEASRPPVPPELRNAFGPAIGLARFAAGINIQQLPASPVSGPTEAMFRAAAKQIGSAPAAPGPDADNRSGLPDGLARFAKSIKLPESGGAIVE